MSSLNVKKEEYIAKIIHDLQSPIVAQVVALNSFLTTAEKKISQEEKDLILLTLNSCNYMQSLVETFNCVYRLSYEPLKLNYEKFDIIEMVQKAINESKILIKYYELNVVFEEKSQIILNADKLLIKKVIENLISNSLNYAFKNSLVEIFIQVTKNNLKFEIISNSQYIEPQMLKDIFQKNKMGTTFYNKNAVGLGLYLSKEIILAHQGVMIAKSNPENTCVLGFSVPLN